MFCVPSTSSILKWQIISHMSHSIFFSISLPHSRRLKALLTPGVEGNMHQCLHQTASKVWKTEVVLFGRNCSINTTRTTYSESNISLLCSGHMTWWGKEKLAWPSSTLERTDEDTASTMHLKFTLVVICLVTFKAESSFRVIANVCYVTSILRFDLATLGHLRLWDSNYFKRTIVIFFFHTRKRYYCCKFLICY